MIGFCFSQSICLFLRKNIFWKKLLNLYQRPCPFGGLGFLSKYSIFFFKEIFLSLMKIDFENRLALIKKQEFL